MLSPARQVDWGERGSSESGISSAIRQSADRHARFRPADAEREDAMQQARIIQSIMLRRHRELLALGDFRVWICLDEIKRAVGRQAKVDARIAVEAERP